MRTEELKPFVVKYYLAGTVTNGYRPSIMIYGPPGIGKSVSIREASEELAKRLGKMFVDYNDDIAHEILSEPDKYFVFNDLRLTEMEPSDLIGIPRDINNHVAYKPLLWGRVMSKTSGILFLDELSNVSRPDVKSVTYKLLLDRKVGYIKFHHDILVIAAGNSTEDSAIAEGLTAPQANRMIIIHLRQPTIDGWAKWNNKKFGDEWDKRTYAFVKAFESDNYLLRLPREPEVERNFPTPRSWSILSVLLSKGINNPEVIEGLLGPEIGGKFIAFTKIKVDINELIREPSRFSELDIDAKYMTCLMLASWIAKHRKNMKVTFDLVDTMTNDRHEYLVFTAKVMKRALLIQFLQELFKYNRAYETILHEIAIVLKSKIV